MNDALFDIKVEQDLKRMEIAEIRHQAQAPRTIFINDRPKEMRLGTVDCSHHGPIPLGRIRPGYTHDEIEGHYPGYRDTHSACPGCGRYYPPSRWNLELFHEGLIG